MALAVSSLYASQGGAFSLPIVELRNDMGRELVSGWLRTDGEETTCSGSWGW